MTEIQLFREDFLGDGLVVKMFSPTIIKESSLFDKNNSYNIYTLETKDGKIRKFNSKSKNLASILLRTHTQVGDWFRLKKDKEEGWEAFKDEKVIGDNIVAEDMTQKSLDDIFKENFSDSGE